MSLESLYQFLILYIWFGLVILLLFWGLMTRTWQRLSGKRMGVVLYALPAIMIGIVAIRNASNPFAAPSALEEVLTVGGSVVFLAQTVILYRQMMRREA